MIQWATSIDHAAAYAAKAGVGIMALLDEPRLSILTFHRVLTMQDALFPYEPEIVQFERIVKFVARGFHTLTLRDAVACLHRGNLPRRAMVVTFDDGYADNVENALPILKAHGVPATFFISTGFLDGGRMWNDTVIECIRACRKSAIDLEEFGFGLCSLDSPTERRWVIDALLPKIKYQGLPDRDRALAGLKRLTGNEVLPDDLMMVSQQVRTLHAAGMEVGAHTVNHPILALLPQAQADQEIRQGKAALEALIQSEVTTMAYPNGKPDTDYTLAHVALAKAAGFAGAVSTAAGTAAQGADLFQLPRYTPWGSSMAAWAARLIANQHNRNIVLAATAEQH